MDCFLQMDDYSFCDLHPLPRQSLFASPSLSTAVPLYSSTDLSYLVARRIIIVLFPPIRGQKVFFQFHWYRNRTPQLPPFFVLPPFLFLVLSRISKILRKGGSWKILDQRRKLGSAVPRSQDHNKKYGAQGQGWSLNFFY